MTPFDSRALRQTGSLLALILVVACGSEKQDSRQDIATIPVRPEISSFEASPATVVTGGDVALAWTTRNVVSVTLEDGDGTEIPVGDASPVEGSITVPVIRTTNYTLRAFGPEGSEGPASRTLTVRAEDPKATPVIGSFSASPSEVVVGGEVKLSWRITGATALTLKDDTGQIIDRGATSLEDGEVVVRPNRSRTVYTLVATGNGVQVTKEIGVDVLGLPSIHQFSVQPIEPVLSGTNITLEWKTSHAGRVLLEDDTGATILDTTEELSGSHSPILTRTTEYTLTATGGGATTTAKVLARVGPRIDEFHASPTEAWVGDRITLSWKTSGADTVFITAPSGETYQVLSADIPDGSTDVELEGSGDYVLSARNGAVVQTWAIHVEATEAPRIRSLVANPEVITAAHDYPNDVELTFAQDGGVTCILYRNGIVIPEYNPFSCGREQTVKVTLTGAADLRLVVVSKKGDREEKMVQVGAVDPARIVKFTKTPERRVVADDFVELAWNVTEAKAVRLEIGGTSVDVGASGTRSERVRQTTLFRLIAENSIGHKTIAEQTVRAGAPEILAFGPETAVAVPGERIGFAWTCDGGDVLILTDADGVEKARTAVIAEIDAGAATFEVPVTPGSYKYTLTVRNRADEETKESFVLSVTDGPVIRSFTASADVVSLGETLHLSWTVLDGQAGTPPTLTLTDGQGTPHDVTGLDTFSFAPEVGGEHVFTLAASTAGTSTPSTSTVTVTVVSALKIVTFTADPFEFHTDGSSEPLSTTLEWETENAVELAIYEADADGAAIPPAVFRLSLDEGAAQSELDHHAVAVRPAASTRYLLRVRNGTGTTLEKMIWVLVDPPQILEFMAASAEILPGETTTLSWRTNNATRMMLKPMMPIVTEIPGKWVDISSSSAAQEVALGSADNSWTSVTFPGGFRFPFDGDLQTGVLVAMNGFLSFAKDIHNSNHSTNQALPSTATYGYVHLAPWWDRLQSYSNKGKVYTLYDDTANTFTVMWKGWSFYSTDTNAVSSLNFEVVLHENGNFEYRYGEMSGTGTTTAAGLVACSSCTIGFQDLTRSAVHQIRKDQVFPNGASNLGWLFELGSLPDGTRQIAPTADKIYKLTALDTHLAVSESITVKVWPFPAVSLLSVYPAGPEVGVPFTVSWQATSATRVRLLDGEGAILCEETDPARIASGSCERTETTAGPRNYSLEVINGIERNKIVYPVNFSIFDSLSLDSFSISEAFIRAGDEITVRWKARGVFEAELRECVPRGSEGDCVRVARTEDPNDGAYTINLTRSKEYRLRVSDRSGRMREASANVWVDIPKITSFTASKQIVAGKSATLSWESDGRFATLSGFPTGQFTEVFLSPYKDISDSGERASMVGGDSGNGRFLVEFPDGFRFPYFGNSYTAISVQVDGWAGFNLTASTTLSNQTLPYVDLKALQFAPFWSDLALKESSRIFYKLDMIDGHRVMILQWTHMQFAVDYYNPGELNFQVVLFETGNIQYRYGEMTSGDGYQDVAKGRYASIGFQSHAGSIGGMLVARNTPVGGEHGLMNRSWEVVLAPEPNGYRLVTPTTTTSYELCVNNESLYEVCDEVEVVVMYPGDLVISEVMVAPEDPGGEWFEVRNISFDPIDLAGFEIVSGAEIYLIPAEQSAVIPPGAYAVLARSGVAADNGGVMPAVVYGNEIDLADASDELVMQYTGVPLDRLSWSAGWPIQTDRSMMFEPSKFERTDSANDSGVNWCASFEVYGGVFRGSPGRLGPGCLDTGAHAYYLLDSASSAPFIDIAKTGTPLTLTTSPFHSAEIPLSFTFNYFDVPVTTMTVMRDGAVAMVWPTGSISTNNKPIPDPNILPNGLIAPMWDTMNSGTRQYEVVEIGGQRAMVVQWTDCAPTNASAAYGKTTFQAQLWQNGDIVFAYGPIQAPNSGFASYTHIYGVNATIGLEDIPAELALTYYYSETATTGARPVYPGRALHFHAK